MFKTASLTPEVLNIVQNKGTETPFSGDYDNLEQSGTYCCRQCGLGIFESASKFHSGCGWPSFDEKFKNNITEQTDRDNIRIEVLCQRCSAHLGHVFHGEKFTSKNTRYCINSLSLDFIPELGIEDTKEAIFAAGCFWGVEYLFKKLPGILKTEVGYCGGFIEHPQYAEVCAGQTGYFEAIRVVYDPLKTDYKKITQYFFEIHDPTQQNGQGPDLGEQYLSVIFYYDQEQKGIAESVIKVLKDQAMRIQTRVSPVSTFWPAEKYHQNYYTRTGKMPYCHFYVKRFT